MTPGILPATCGSRSVRERLRPRLLPLLLAWTTLAACSGPPPEPVLALVNVTLVHPEAARVEPAQTVLVSGGLISRVGPAEAIEVPPGATVIEGSGRYLMAGLTEMHAHVPEQRDGAQFLEDMLFLWVANGVTTVRGMRGADFHLEVRERLASGELLGPRLVTSGASFLGNSVATAEAARALATAQADAGFDFVKVHMGLSREAYDAVIEVARERGLPVAGHVSELVGLGHALASRQDSIDHLDGYPPLLVARDADVSGVPYGLMGLPLVRFIDPERIPEAARLTREAGAWNGPTLTMMENFALPEGLRPERPGLEYMPRGMVLGWQRAASSVQRGADYDPDAAQLFMEYRRLLVRALHEAGAGLLLASDAPQVLNVPGFSTHEELDALVAAGLTPAEALVTGTVNPALWFGRADEFGRIAEGLAADLVLVAGNPLEDLRTLREPEAVVLRGRWLPGAGLREGLARIAARQAAGE